LERLVEREEPVAAIVAAGFDRDTVLKIERMLHRAEYKRRQSAPGVKVTLKNFGRDRRYPITNVFRDSDAPPAERAPDSAEAPSATSVRAKRAARDGGMAARTSPSSLPGLTRQPMRRQPRNRMDPRFEPSGGERNRPVRERTTLDARFPEGRNRLRTNEFGLSCSSIGYCASLAPLLRGMSMILTLPRSEDP